MIYQFIRKELRERYHSPRYLLSSLAISVLIVLSFVIGVENYNQARSSYETAVHQHEKTLSSYTSWLEVDHQILLPPQPLSVLVSGISQDIGRKINISDGGELVNTDSRFGDETVFAVFRFMDLEFLFTIVLTLFAIVMAFDAVNGERERGTLQLIFAQPVSRAAFIIGKVTGMLLALIVPLLIPLSLGLLYLLFSGMPMDTEAWIKLFGVLTTGLIITAITMMLSVGISSLVRQSSTSFMVLLGIWIFMVIILPKSSVLLAGNVVEVPNIDKILMQKANYRSELFQQDRSKMTSFKPQGDTEDAQEIFKQYQKYLGDLATERSQKIRSFNRKLNENLRNTQNQRQKVSLSIAQISPVATASLAMTTLAGTSLDLEHKFMDQAQAYRTVYRQFVEEKTGQDVNSSIRFMISGGDGDAPNINIEEMPRFQFKPSSALKMLKAALIKMLQLLAWFTGSFLFAWLTFIKTDIK